jgi:hypothetical protein
VLAALNLRSEATALPRGQPPMRASSGCYWPALKRSLVARWLVWLSPVKEEVLLLP